MSAGLVWFSNAILPEANSKARSIFIDIRLKKPGFELEPNVFYDGIEGYTFLVDRIDPLPTLYITSHLFQEPTTSQNRAYIKADKGYLTSESTEALTLHLFDGEILLYPSKRTATRDRNMEQIEFNKHRKTFDLSDLAFTRSGGSGSSRSDRTMSIRAMTFVVDTLEQEIKELRDQIVEDSISTLHPATFNQPASSSKNNNSGSIAQTNLFVSEPSWIDHSTNTPSKFRL